MSENNELRDDPLHLTDKESEILGLVTKGYSYEGIAEKLRVVTDTVLSISERILFKVETIDHIEAVQHLKEKGLVTDSSDIPNLQKHFELASYRLSWKGNQNSEFDRWNKRRNRSPGLFMSVHRSYADDDEDTDTLEDTPSEGQAFRLSEIQRKDIDFLSRGYTLEDICAIMYFRRTTIAGDIHRILRKLKANSPRKAIQILTESGLIRDGADTLNLEKQFTNALINRPGTFISKVSRSLLWRSGGLLARLLFR